MATESVEQRAHLQKRVLRVVALSQLLGGAGLAAGITVGALLAADMLGSEALAGLPSTVFTLGSAVAAYSVGWLTGRRGRRPALALGFLAGALGAVGVVIAAALNSPVGLFVALFVYGAGTSTNLQARYAATDLEVPAKRGRATSIALLSTTVGAVAGPLLVEPTGAVATAIGLPALTGPFLLAACAFGAAGLVFAIFLRPDPYLLVAHESGSQQNTGKTDPAVFVAALLLIVANVVMVGVMTVTPVVMKHNGESLSAVGVVMSFHIAAMWLPSPLSSYLVDKVGRVSVALMSLGTLCLAGVVAAVGSHQFVTLTIALVLLGLGWNFGLVSGTTMVVDTTDVHSRPRVQGTVDVLIALCSSLAGGTAGLVAARWSYSTVAIIAIVLVVAVVPAVLWYANHARTTAQLGQRTRVGG